MPQPDWARVKDVFAAACALPVAGRAGFLRAACAGDAAVHAEVASLLAHHGDDDDLLADNLEPPPPRIGPFRILERIGSGGMGVVYRAEQDHPKRQVALKVLACSASSSAARRRFEHEAELLGRLQHPGIAQVFAAGHAEVGDDVRPFFAMELIAGDALDEHARRRDRRARCELMAKVADAVHHAHQKGVIHCDLKPGNVLVGADGQPKVLDFGIARALDDGADSPSVTSLRTTHLQIAGTLAYMSPEQAAGDARELDVRADVYALGVMTYEVLAGHLPLDLADKDLLAALNCIATQEPLPLATHDRSLRGDLSTITHRALRKARDERYDSASAFAADLRRFLRDEPIAARPPSTVYTLRKFAKRHRALVAGAAALACTLLVGVLTTSFGMARAVRAEARATRAKDYLRQRILTINPDEVGGQVNLVQVVERAADDVARTFADDPLGCAEMELTIASTLRSLGSFARAVELSRSAHTTLQAELGAGHVRTRLALGEVAQSLARCGRRDEAAELFAGLLGKGQPDLPVAEALALRAGYAHVLADQGHTDSAAAHFADVARRAAAALGTDALVYLDAESALANVRVRCGAAEEGTRGLRAAIAAVEGRYGADHPAALQLRYALTTSLVVAGHAEEAQKELEDLLPRQVRVLGDTHPATRHVRCSLAISHQQQSRLAEAEAVLLPLRALVEQRDVSEAGLRTRVVTANLRAHGGRLDEAVGIARAASEDAERVLGKDAPLTLEARSELVHALCWQRSPDANDALDALLRLLHEASSRHDTLLVSTRLKAGVALMQMGRMPEAEAFWRESLAALPAKEREASGPGIEIENYLLYVLLQLGRLREAAELGDVVVPAARRVHGERSPTTLFLMHNHAGVLRRLDRLAPAIALYRECLTIRTELLGPTHDDTRTSRKMLALALIEAGDADAAGTVTEELLRIEEGLDADSDTTIIGQVFAARVQLLRQDAAAAARALEGLLGRLAGKRPTDDATLLGARSVLAEALLLLGRGADAEEHARMSLAGVGKDLPGSWEEAAARALHGRCLAACGRHAEAETALVDAVAVFTAKLGAGHSRTLRAGQALATVYDAQGKMAEAAAVRTAAAAANGVTGRH